MGLLLRFFTFMHSLLLLLFSLQTVAHSASSMHPICHDDERVSLLQFKKSLFIDKCDAWDTSASPKVASWTAEEENGDCCSWEGVTCNKITGHVVKLDLSSSCLYGSINSSSSLFHLVHLEWLSLAYNDFTQSEIPSEIIKLSSLSHLNFSSSYFSGQIPSEILHLSKLTSFDVSHNYLELQKPGLRSLVEKLTNLQILNLDSVNISSSIPHTLANFSSLTYLSLEACNLHGEFPAKIFQLPNLQFLRVSYNPYLTGYLPNFEKSNPLRELRLDGTGFSGDIPNSIANLKSLVSLGIGDNNFSRANLPSLGNLESLQELDLSYNNFSCQNCRSLSWISKLRNLTSVDLSELNIFGEIPSWLMNLTQLSQLTMDGNQLTGPIPNWLMNMSKLTFLSLSHNQLTGHIPPEISNLSQLAYLCLTSNRLEGPIPSSISELENLRDLTLSSNNLSGTLDLDMFLSKLKSLQVLVLSSNNLSVHTETTVDTGFWKFIIVELSSCNLREFPKFLQNQDKLWGLDLSSNKIAGLIPGWLLNSNANGFSFLNLSHNLLTGFDHHPVIFRNWTGTHPVTLDLSYNKLQGPLPVPSVFTYSYLVSNNQLTGEISPSICSLNGLYALDLSHNNLIGKLPDCLGNFSDQLSLLKLQGNKFHGSILDTFMRGTDLRMIDLSQNLLQGRLPKSLVNCTKLEFLDLGSNTITDIFPSWLGALPELKVLILKLNRFYGVIKEPVTNFRFPKLQIIDLSHNRFTGNLPSKYFQYWNGMKFINASQLKYMQGELVPPIAAFLPSLGYGYSDYSLEVSNKGIEMEYLRLSNLFACIVLSSNEFVGEIPRSIGDLKWLRCLNLSRNNLQGRIPESFSNLTMLESLDLSNNKLYDKIPRQLVELTSLEFFDVSHNNLSGPIPQGKQFDTFQNSSFDGNPGLCGKPLSKRCESSDAPQQEDEEDEGSSSTFVFGWKTVLIGYASGMITGLVLGNTVTKWKSRWFAKTFGLGFNPLEKKRRD